MALNLATLHLILCRQIKTIKHGSVRINIVHFPTTCFLNFCSAVPTTFFSFLLIFLLVHALLLLRYNLLSLLPRIQHTVRSSLTFKACTCMMISICDACLVIINYIYESSRW